MDSTEALWDYMKASVPEITGDDMPVQEGDRYWHHELLAAMGQPRLRDITWNNGFTGKVRFSDKCAHNILALAVYLAGKEAEEPCNVCRKRNGPFVGCMLPQESTWGDASQKACANCIYNWQYKRCCYNPETKYPCRGSVAHDEGQGGLDEAAETLEHDDMMSGPPDPQDHGWEVNTEDINRKFWFSKFDGCNLEILT